MKEKLLVISNCQAVGLGNSLSLFCPQAEVEICDVWKFVADSKAWIDKFPEYRQLIVNPEINGMGVVDFSAMSNVVWVPGFLFRGFHPDLCYVTVDGKGIDGPIGYHSALTLAAFQARIPVSKAVDLFNGVTYEKIGFFSIWESEKSALCYFFQQHGLDISSDFVMWMRGESFMHTVNHPKITALYDVARRVAHKIYGKAAESGIKPHDNLLAGPIFPIYPEIAERYGVASGSLYFKPVSEYRVMTLDDFIARSYAIYESHDQAALKTDNIHFDRAMAVCQGNI